MKRVWKIVVIKGEKSKVKHKEILNYDYALELSEKLMKDGASRDINWRTYTITIKVAE